MRAGQLRAGRSRRRGATIALTLAAAAILLLPGVGLGGRLVDVLADRHARPALQEYLLSLPAGHGIGALDVPQARELIDADTARGKITLFEVPSASGFRCIGFYAHWVPDPGIGCGYTNAAPRDLAESLVARLDPHVIAIAGVAPSNATSVELDVAGTISKSPIAHGFFLFALDPATLGTRYIATLTAVGSNGQSSASHTLDLAGFFHPPCTQHLPSRTAATLTLGGATVEIHEAHTSIERCWWVESNGEIEGGIDGEPIPRPTRSPSSGPAILLRTATFASGAVVFWGEAQIPAKRATITLADGTTETEPITNGYLLAPLAPKTTPGKRPVRIELYSEAGKRLSSQPVDPDNPQELMP